MEKLAWDIVLQNNSFFRNSDFEKVKSELEQATNPKRYALYLKYNIGVDEEEYNKWRI